MALTENLLRGGGRDRPVTNEELFFDLVYVFAVTQLSHHLLTHTTITGAWQTAQRTVGGVCRVHRVSGGDPRVVRCTGRPPQS